jgi:hypothetical protein
MNLCHCRGTNEYCQFCFGSGVIKSVEGNGFKGKSKKGGSKGLDQEKLVRNYLPTPQKMGSNRPSPIARLRLCPICKSRNEDLQEHMMGAHGVEMWVRWLLSN